MKIVAIIAFHDSVQATTASGSLKTKEDQKHPISNGMHKMLIQKPTNIERDLSSALKGDLSSSLTEVVSGF